MGSHLLHRGIGQISTYFALVLSPSLEFMVKIIQLLLNFLNFIFCCIIRTLTLFREKPTE